jgi:hypothetical protein
MSEEATYDREQGTGNREQGTAKREQGAGNRHSLRRGPDSGRRGTRYGLGHNIDWVRKITEAPVFDPANEMRRKAADLTCGSALRRLTGR